MKNNGKTTDHIHYHKQTTKEQEKEIEISKTNVVSTIFTSQCYSYDK